MSIKVQSITDPGAEEKTTNARPETVDSGSFPETMEQAVQEMPDSVSVRAAAKPRVITSMETTRPSDSSAASTAVYETILGSMRTRRVSFTDDKGQPVESASLSETEESTDGAAESPDRTTEEAVSPDSATSVSEITDEPSGHTSTAARASDESLDSIFVEAGNTYQVSPILLKAIATQESGLQNGLTSSAGAEGIMQLMPATARGLGVTDSMDVYQNIMGGAKLISSNLSKYSGNLDLALAAYNAGSGNVDKYGGVPPFKETQDYIVQVKKNLETVTIHDGAGEGQESMGNPALNTKTDLPESSGAAGDIGSSADGSSVLAETIQNLQPSDLTKMLQLQMMLASSGLRNPDDYSGF
jgi:soluble lytic murein transglycosylase-like protein